MEKKKKKKVGSVIGSVIGSVCAYCRDHQETWLRGVPLPFQPFQTRRPRSIDMLHLDGGKTLLSSEVMKKVLQKNVDR